MPQTFARKCMDQIMYTLVLLMTGSALLLRRPREISRESSRPRGGGRWADLFANAHEMGTVSRSSSFGYLKAARIIQCSAKVLHFQNIHIYIQRSLYDACRSPSTSWKGTITQALSLEYPFSSRLVSCALSAIITSSIFTCFHPDVIRLFMYGNPFMSVPSNIRLYL